MVASTTTNSPASTVSDTDDLTSALLTVRRGTAFFGRKLNELPDEKLIEPSLLPGWPRAHVIAHVGYNARAIARLVKWANTGIETPMYSTPQARNDEIEFGATLPPNALRHLYEHSAIHLDVEWRDSSGPAWAAHVKTAQGRTVPLTETIWMRAREVWLHAVDLDNGATFQQIPSEVLTRLLGDIIKAWQNRGEGADIALQVTDHQELSGMFNPTSKNFLTITGTLAEVTAWASGRYRDAVTTDARLVPQAPRWI